jgi:hypothetical protein
MAGAGKPIMGRGCRERGIAVVLSSDKYASRALDLTGSGKNAASHRCQDLERRIVFICETNPHARKMPTEE